MIPITYIQKTIAISFEGFLKANEKVKRETGNKIGDEIEIGIVKLLEGKKLKNLTKVKKSIKFKFVKVVLNGVAP